MYEICRFLAAKRAPKPVVARAPRKPPIKAGAACNVYGNAGTIVGPHATIKGWWVIDFTGQGVSSFDRSQIDITA